MCVNGSYIHTVEGGTQKITSRNFPNTGLACFAISIADLARIKFPINFLYTSMRWHFENCMSKTCSSVMYPFTPVAE